MEYLATKLPASYKHGIRLLAAVRGQSMESLASEMIMKMFHDDEYYHCYSLAFQQSQRMKREDEISKLKTSLDIALSNYIDALKD